MRITVFTPAFNRGYTIENLYRSLQRQKFHDFEWVVIDDGSKDNTSELFDKWCREDNAFPIIYQKVQNGGKHRAINKGVKIARGELFFIVDSDDCVTDDALERIDAVERTIDPDVKCEFCGVCGQKGKVGDPVGTTYAADGYLDITALEREKYGITGDKAEAFDTGTLKKYPFPEFDGEKFITECVVWDKIASEGLKLRFFNEVVYLCDYLPDGLTAQGYELYANSPRGWGLYIWQSIQYGKVRGKSARDHYLNYYYSVRKKNVALLQAAEYLHCKKSLLFSIVMKDVLIQKPVTYTKKTVRRALGNGKYEAIKSFVRKGK